MTDGDAGVRTTAGAMLRAARERQGLHIAALAAAIKVAPRKLDALEHDRYDELTDATFTRALAQTVCRTLKIDARPVLALLPQPDLASLEHVAGSLNTPFRERSGRDDNSLAVSAIRPLVWASGALMVAALVVHFLPDRFWETLTPAAETAPAAAVAAASAAMSEVTAALASAPVVAAASAVLGAPTPSAEPMATQVPAAAAVVPASVPPVSQPATPSGTAVATVVLPVPSATAAVVAAPPAKASIVTIRTTGASWIEVQDANGQPLLSRIVQPGESVGLDGALPMKLKIGNVSGTQLGFRGQPVDLAAVARDNVARLELK